MSLLLFILIAVVVTAVATWFISQAIFAKSAVLPAVHEVVKREVEDLRRELHTKTQLHTKAENDCKDALGSARHYQDLLREEGKKLAEALANCNAANQNLEEARTARQLAGQALQEANMQLQEAHREGEKWKAENKAGLEKLALQQQFLVDAKSMMEREFKVIAQDTLTANSRQISEQQKEKLENTLQPFREQIEAFRKQVDEKFNAEVADRNNLKGELSKVFALTNSLTDQTNRLSKALTSNTKTQGNWGEDILLTILQNAGMIEGEHFEKQFHALNEDGQRIIPDIVIKCPDNYSLVVDSKVSLTHYVNYCNAEAPTPEEERGLRRDIYQSFKAHIDGLSGKKYESIAHCADFVLMFAPIESAFTVAAQHDSDIRNYAFQKKVFLVTPSNLLLVVKMIGDLWQQDRVNKEAQDMADRAQKLYEKACGFLGSFTSMGSALGKAQEQFDKATGQLTGGGGLVRQGELLKGLLGKSTQKVIPEDLLKRTSKTESEDFIAGNTIVLL